MSPEAVARLRALLVALCAALSGFLPKRFGVDRAFEAAFAWLDGIGFVPVAEVVLASEDTVKVARAKLVRARAPSHRRTARRMVRAAAAQTTGIMPVRRFMSYAAARKPRAAVAASRAIFAKI